MLVCGGPGCGKTRFAGLPDEAILRAELRQFSQGSQILAITTQVRELPQSLRKLIGDRSHSGHRLVGLDLRLAA